MKIPLLIVCTLALVSESKGQELKNRIDRKDLRGYLKVLTSDSLGGRGTGTEGQKKAERFIAGRFSSLGLTPYRPGGYSEKFKLNRSYWAEVYIKTPKSTLRNIENMVFQCRDAQNEESDAAIVFGGHGTEQELKQIDVKNRLVLVFVNNLRGSYDLNLRLKRMQAAGLILANSQNEKQFESVKNSWREPATKKWLSLPDSDSSRLLIAEWDTVRFINTISIPNSEVAALCGRSIRELNNLIEAKRISEVPVSSVKVKFERIRDQVETSNVVAVIRGRSEKSIVISAHYDHLGRYGREYFPGADDNASGVAAMLEIAEAFADVKDLPYSIVFVATSGEENGLLGSRYHVSRTDFDPNLIVCNLNLDMLSRTDEKHNNGQYLYCIGTDQLPELDSLVRKADGKYDKCSFDYTLNNTKDPLGIFTRSDNYSFYRRGIPAIHFFSGMHADYHKSTDTAEKIDYINLENRVRQISVVVELLQRELKCRSEGSE